MKTFFSLWLCLSLWPVLQAEELTWLTSYPEALTQAQAEDKVVMLNFTGSDWCGWCIKLRKEVFEQPEFKAFAQANLVLVEVDFPRRKPLADEQVEANQKLQAEFGVRGYPTLHFLDKKGTRLHRGGYVPGGPKAFIAAVTSVAGYSWKKSGDAPIDATVEKPAKTQGPATFAPPPPAKIRYEELALKGISGPKTKRMALINNQTFVAGETAEVKLGEGKVPVLCQEIREDSVLILVAGEKEPKELKLRLPTLKK